MKTQNPSTSLGEGRDVAPSLAHPSQKKYLVVYTGDLTHLDHLLQLDRQVLLGEIVAPLHRCELTFFIVGLLVSLVP